MNVEGDAHTHYRLGYVYEKKGLPINAVAAYEQALALDPDIKWARFNLASLYARSGEYNRAIAAYGEFIRRFPEVARARLALGNVYLRTGRHAEAIAAYESLLDAKDADARGSVRTARLCSRSVGDSWGKLRLRMRNS